MKRVDTINIAFATDDNYVMPTCVAMTSLFENNPEEIAIYLLSIKGHLSTQSKSSLQQVADRYHQSITFTDVTEQQFDGLPILRHGLSSYLRLFTPSLYPDIDKLLYLDADIVVDGSIAELYNTNMDEHQAAGVTDQMTLKAEHLQRIGYKHDRPYINTGVLLLNLKALRQIYIKSCISEYLTTYHDALRYGDQDIINCILPEILIIPPKYNAISLLWNGKRKKRESIWNRAQIAEAQLNPVIIHYITPVKPWHLKCTHFLRSRWYHYAAMSAYRDFRPQRSRSDILTLINIFTIGNIKNLAKRIAIGKPEKL